MKLPKHFWLIVFSVLVIATQFSQFKRSGDRNALVSGFLGLAVIIVLFWILNVLVFAPIGRFLQRRRAQRRKNVNPITIKLFTIKFPELEHLPPEERETILRRCAESFEMRRFQRQLRLVGFIPVAISLPLFFILLFHKHWRFVPAWFLFMSVFSLSIIGMFAYVIFGRVRILRKLVKLELQR